MTGTITMMVNLLGLVSLLYILVSMYKHYKFVPQMISLIIWKLELYTNRFSFMFHVFLQNSILKDQSVKFCLSFQCHFISIFTILNYILVNFM